MISCVVYNVTCFKNFLKVHTQLDISDKVYSRDEWIVQASPDPFLHANKQCYEELTQLIKIIRPTHSISFLCYSIDLPFDV